MGRRLKHTERQLIAKSVLDFIDWELEPTEQEKAIQTMIGDLDVRRNRPRAPRILVTVEVMKLRGAAMDALKNQIIAHTSGIGEGSIKTSFKRLEEQRQYGSHGPRNY
jgi:hypothetical protein